MEKVVGICDHLCLFCGENMEWGIEDRDVYYYCNCPDAKKLRVIEKQIKDLEYSKPRHKFRIKQQEILIKI